MKKFIRLCSLILSTAALLVMQTGCDTPLSLGSKINTEKPVINNGEGDNQPGSFLQGNDNPVAFEVKQEFGISEVYMTLYWTDENGEEQSRKVPAELDPKTGLYNSNIDTTGIPDGQVRAQVTAVDVSGNKSTTTDMIYTVKNKPPQLEMTIPAIRGGTMFNEDGTKNTLYPSNTVPDFDDPDLTNLLKNDPVYMGFELMGFAEDIMGIEEGYPQIKIWPVPRDSAEYVSYGLDIHGNPRPSSQYDEWHPVKKPNNISGLKATKFSYDISRVAYNMAGDYRFILKTMDVSGVENFYPYRTDNHAGSNGEQVPAEDHPNKYIQINYMASDIPIVMIREIPMYYNGIGEFKVEMTISSQNELVEVKAYISDDVDFNADADPSYDVSWDSTSTPNSYSAILTINNPSGWQENESKWVHIVAIDDQGKVNPAAYRNFTFDQTPPNVDFERPESISTEIKSGELPGTGGSYVIYDVSDVNAGGERFSPNWVTGQITIGGSSLDNMSGIRRVYYHIGYLGDDEAADSNLAAIYKIDDIDDEDDNENATWKNSGLGGISSLKPGWSGGLYAWSYTANFNEYGLANKDKIQTSHELGLSDGFEFETPDKNNMDKDSRFFLPFYVKVVDGAGNYLIAQYKLCIDPNMDTPLVTISYPSNNSMVGGEVRLSGIANDNNKVYSVQIRVKTDPNSVSAAWFIPADAVPFNPASHAYRYAVPGMETDTDGWFRANKIGDDMTVSWYYNINSNGELNPTGDASAKREVRIEVRAIDTKKQMYEDTPDLVGPAEVITVNFSNDTPQITNPKITKEHAVDKDYIEGITTSGTFSISLAITDAEAIYNANASLGSLNVTLMQGGIPQSLPDGWTLSNPVPESGRQRYTLNINNINSTSYFPYGTTGSMTLNVKAENERESGNLSTERVYTIGIDNFFPTAEIETPTNALGKDFPVLGTAKDYGNASGAIQGLERMLVYFEKAQIKYNGTVRTVEGTGEYLNPRAKPIPDTGTGDSFYNKTVYTSQSITWSSSMPAMDSYPYLRDGEGAPGPNLSNTIKFPLLRPITKGEGINATVVWESPHAMVIDEQELGADQDLDEDGTFGEIWNGVADKTWQARMDTTAFPDGPLMVHYIVMDQAGNATHYQKDIYIENNKPLIEYINLGTDINGNGSVADWVDDDEAHGEFLREPVTIMNTTSGSGKNVIDPPFRVRNDRFKIMLKASGGNGIKHAKASYVTVANTIPVTEMERGRVYTIASAGATDWQQYGAPNSNINTTFVASGPGKGSGRVTEYTEVKSATGVLVSNGTNSYYNILFDDSHFGLATDGLIPDSLKDGIGDVTAANANARLFIIKVYDETVSGAGIQEEDQLAHAVLVGLDIDNDDSKVPEIQINQFYWINESDNSLYGNSKKNGHIELGTRPQVSGQVSFRGTATDNTGIGKIYFVINGHGGGYGVTGTTINGSTYYEAASFSGGSWTTGKYFTANGWEFTIEKEIHDQSGHHIEWRLDYDSGKITGAARTGNVLTVIARDTRTLTPGANTSDEKTFTFDVVPYISELETNLSSAYSTNPSAFNRSALGWYPVREGEIIQIEGFNLTGATAYVDPPNEIGTAFTLNAPTPAQLDTAGITTVDSGTHKNIIVDSGTSSGFLRVRVNNIDSINNDNSNSAGYNQEHNGVNNNRLTDDRKLYVWNTGYLVNSTNISSPVMRMSDDSSRFIGFSTYDGSTAVLKVINNNTGLSAAGVPSTGTTATDGSVVNQQNRYVNSTVAVTPQGEWAVMASNMTSGQGNLTITYNQLGVGSSNADGSNTLTAASNRFRRMLNMQSDALRIKYPRLAVQRTGANAIPARILVGYYDSLPANMPIVLHNGSYTSTGTGAGAGWTGNIPNANANANAAIPYAVADNASAKAKSGQYMAVGFLSNGRPVIAWYDSTNQCLWFSYSDAINDSLTATSATDFQSTTGYQNNAVKIKDYAGTHVDLAVDSSDNVHLAYVDVKNGGLWYTYIPATNGGTSTAIPNSLPVGHGNSDTAPSSTIRTVGVDTYLSAGQKLMINVRNKVPYISYIHKAFAETTNSVRVAWPVRAINGNADVSAGTNPSDDTFTGNWEVMTVPAGTIPLEDEFVCNGVPTSGNLAAPPSTSTLKTYTDMNTSILVSYMTQSWYEGAVLKYDIAASPGQ